MTVLQLSPDSHREGLCRCESVRGSVLPHIKVRVATYGLLYYDAVQYILLVARMLCGLHDLEFHEYCRATLCTNGSILYHSCYMWCPAPWHNAGIFCTLLYRYRYLLATRLGNGTAKHQSINNPTLIQNVTALLYRKQVHACDTISYRAATTSRHLS